MRIFFIFLLGLLPSFALAQAVAFVLSATPVKKVQYQTTPVVADPIGNKPTWVVPTQTLSPGQTLRLPKGTRLALAIMSSTQPHRRVYIGPALLQVRSDHITVLHGVKPQVSPLPENAAELIAQWQEFQQEKKRLNAHDNKIANTALTLIEPGFDEVLLHRNPILKWQGLLPRESNLVIFDGQGKRFWSQAVEEHTIEFPHTVEFEWGQTYRFELRKATGGRLLEGQFEIASEATAKTLLDERANYLSAALPEWRLLYAMRLYLAKAYAQAQPLWLGLGLDGPIP